MLTPKRNTHHFEFLPGGVPAGIIFDGQIEDAYRVANVRPEHEADLREEIGAELAFIGLVAYFEGFCKNHTATILNICPQLVRTLAQRNREIKLNAVDILNYAEHLPTNFGSLIVERIDFGTAKSINNFYRDLLDITPLSGREAKVFHSILDDRHLIVHHGNIFTPTYLTERFVRREIGQTRCFLDSLKITHVEVRSAGEFLQKLSLKIRTASCRALRSVIANDRIQLPKTNRKAIDLLDSTMKST